MVGGKWLIADGNKRIAFFRVEIQNNSFYSWQVKMRQLWSSVVICQPLEHVFPLGTTGTLQLFGK